LTHIYNAATHAKWFLHWHQNIMHWSVTMC